MAQVLIIEDDDRIRPLVVKGLRELGHVVTSAPTGMAGLQLAVDSVPDLVVLDLGLPDVDGTQVLSMLRAVSAVPVIIARARDDDYVVKPYSSAQLDARIRAVLRRSESGREVRPTITIGALVIDTAARRVFLAEQEVELTPKEFDLLAHLGEHAGEVVAKRDLLAEVWRQPWGGSDKTVDVHLSWLRRKLGETAAEPRYLKTVRGVGVRLAAPDEGC